MVCTAGQFIANMGYDIERNQARWIQDQTYESLITWLTIQPGSLLAIAAYCFLFHPRVVRFALGR